MNAQLLTVLLGFLLTLGAIVFNATSGKQIERVIFGYFAIIFTSPTPSPSATPTSTSQATFKPEPTPTSSPSATPTSTSQAIFKPEPTPTSSPSSIPTSSPSSIPTSSPSSIPNSNNCAGGFYIPPNTWYGPFDNRFSLTWDQQNIYTDDLQRRIYSPYYPNHPIYPIYPQANFIRGTWNRLSSSPFNVCIEPSSGRVFGQYNP